MNGAKCLDAIPYIIMEKVMKKKIAIKLLQEVVDNSTFIKNNDGTYTWAVSFSTKVSSKKEIQAIKELVR